MKKEHWNYLRTVLFYIVGLFNTVFIRPEDIGSWKNYLGYIFIVIALADTFFIVKKLMMKKAEKN